MRFYLLWLMVTCLLMGCGSTGSSGSNSNKEKPLSQQEGELKSEASPASSPGTSPTAVPGPIMTLEGPEGEMLSGLNRPKINLKSGDGGLAELPKDREGLLKTANKAFRDGDLAYAIAVVDVLNLMFPNDPEILELRGETLMGQGLKEDAMVDFDKCCSLGRMTCCR